MRLLLGLDAPAASTSEAPPAEPAADEPVAAQVADATTTRLAGGTPSRESPKPSVDDFAALNLTPAELQQLQAELERGETFNGALVRSESLDKVQPPPLSTIATGSTPAPVQTPRSKGLFGLASYFVSAPPPPPPPKDELDERANKVHMRAGPERPIASDSNADADLDDIVLSADEVAELERSFDNDAATRRRETSEGSESAPKSEAQVVGGQTSVENDGGASLSAPIAEVERLRLSENEVEQLASEVASGSGGVIEVVMPESPEAPPSEGPSSELSEPSDIEEDLGSAAVERSNSAVSRTSRSSTQQIDALKRKLSSASATSTGSRHNEVVVDDGDLATMPSFGIEAMKPKDDGAPVDSAVEEGERNE